MPGVRVLRGDLRTGCRCVDITPPSPPGPQELGPSTPMVASLSPPTDTGLSALPAIGDLRPRPWRPAGTLRLCPANQAPRSWAHGPCPPGLAQDVLPQPEPCAGTSRDVRLGLLPRHVLFLQQQTTPLPQGAGDRTARASSAGDGRLAAEAERNLYFWEARLPDWGNTFGPHRAGGRAHTSPAPAGTPAAREVTALNSRRPPKLRQAAARAIKAKALRKKC